MPDNIEDWGSPADDSIYHRWAGAPTLQQEEENDLGNAKTALMRSDFAEIWQASHVEYTRRQQAEPSVRMCDVFGRIFFAAVFVEFFQARWSDDYSKRIVDKFLSANGLTLGGISTSKGGAA